MNEAGDCQQKAGRLPQVLGDYAAANAARFHMPGHKGRGMQGFWRPELAAWDVTELSHTDNLHEPTGILAAAQADCAACYGAENTFFLVNGSTAGLLAMMLCLPRGERVLLGRDCHKAALSGAVLAGLEATFVLPEYDARYGMWGMVSPEALEQALTASPAAAVLINSPNYYGMCADIPALSAVAHRHGAMLFVDGAHGAHFPFGKRLPPSPAGFADLWVNSAHKTLNALGQAALLHRGGECPLPHWRVQQALSLVQTSSPSYLLTASLDWARYSAQNLQDWDAHIAFCEEWGHRIQKLPGLQVLDGRCAGIAGIAKKDPTRLVIDVAHRGITGFTAAQWLEKQNVFVEMADGRRLVCICTPSDDTAWYQRLFDALQGMPFGREEPPGQIGPGFTLPRQERPVWEAARGKQRLMPLKDAAGHVAAEAVGPYPPGIALWAPGETIRGEDVERMLRQQSLGCALFGLREGMVAVAEE